MSKNEQAIDNISLIPKRAKKRRRRKIILTVVIVTVLVVGLLTTGIIVLRNKVTEQYASSSTSDVESYSVTTGSISTTVSGTGTLTEEGTESVEIPNGITLDKIYVEEGDSVSAGDLIAAVNTTSVISAMADLQAQLDEIDAELEDASDDAVGSSITSGLTARVKKIYAEAGDDVATVMYENGSLMLLSLDGYMALDLETDSLAAGDSVTVTLSDGTEKSGTVDSVSDGIAIILIADNGPVYGDEVTVKDADGNELGSSVLYIHSPLEVTGFAGTVYSVRVSENGKVYSGTTLLTLTDTSYTANYDTILEERADVEEQLQALITLYKEGTLCAPISGIVESVDYDIDSDTASTASTDASTTEAAASDSTSIVTISPNESMSITISVDETDILSLSVGQEATVTIDSIGEDTYTGTVSEISTTATSSSGVTQYSAVVTIGKTSQMLSGMSASVVIKIEGVDNALLIPIDALHQTSSSAYVYTEYDEETGELSGMVEVTIGLSNSSYVEITSGLSEGDTVYYTPASEDTSTSSFGSTSGRSEMGNFSSGESSGMPSGSSSGMPSGSSGFTPGG